MFISPAEDMYAVSLFNPSFRFQSVNMRSYLVTDLMKTDLETLLKAKKPIENEFVQYLLYQMMVGLPVTSGWYKLLIGSSARPKISTLSGRGPPRPQTK